MVAVDNLSQVTVRADTPSQFSAQDCMAMTLLQALRSRLRPKRPCKTCGSSNSLPTMGVREGESFRNVSGNSVK